MIDGSSSNPIQVAVMADYLTGGVQIAMRLKFSPGEYRYGKINEQGRLEMVHVPEDQMYAQRDATLVLQEDFARALLDELLRYYQGASDMHTVRADLLHERGRVDKLIETVSKIAMCDVT